MSGSMTAYAIALAAVLTAGSAWAAEGGRGPEIGSVPPDFTLASVTDGAEHTLAEHRGERPVVLVFFRGAW